MKPFSCSLTVVLLGLICCVGSAEELTAEQLLQRLQEAKEKFISAEYTVVQEDFTVAEDQALAPKRTVKATERHGFGEVRRVYQEVQYLAPANQPEHATAFDGEFLSSYSGPSAKSAPKGRVVRHDARFEEIGALQRSQLPQSHLLLFLPNFQTVGLSTYLNLLGRGEAVPGTNGNAARMANVPYEIVEQTADTVTIAAASPRGNKALLTLDKQRDYAIIGMATFKDGADTAAYIYEDVELDRVNGLWVPVRYTGRSLAASPPTVKHVEVQWSSLNAPLANPDFRLSYTTDTLMEVDESTPASRAERARNHVVARIGEMNHRFWSWFE